MSLEEYTKMGPHFSSFEIKQQINLLDDLESTKRSKTIYLLCMTNYKANKLWTAQMKNGSQGSWYNRTKFCWFDEQTFKDQIFSDLYKTLSCPVFGDEVLVRLPTKLATRLGGILALF